LTLCVSHLTSGFMEKIGKPTPGVREAKLAQALRANLRRRKISDLPQVETPPVATDKRW